MISKRLALTAEGVAVSLKGEPPAIAAPSVAESSRSDILAKPYTESSIRCN
jgi:hypothetical protein